MIAQPEKTIAIVVGVEQYKEDDPHWQLDGPALDACKFARWLSDHQVPVDNIDLLLSPLESNELEVGALSEGFRTAWPDRAAVRAKLTTDLYTKKSDLLIVYWGGHGVVDNDSRRVLYADATADDKANLDITDMMRGLRSQRYRHHPRQLIFVDACMTLSDDLGWARTLPSETLPGGLEEPQREQYAFFAASPGQRAINDDSLKTGIFSDTLREVVNHSLPETSWPPQPVVLRRLIEDRFEALNSAGRTAQVPSYIGYRSRNDEGAVRYSHRLSGRKRLLIVEDIIGDQLTKVFGNHDCTVAKNLDEFWSLTDHAEQFDAALVDLHLGEQLIDQQGLCVVEWLVEHTAVPAVVMTAQPVEGMDFGKILMKYNLVGFCMKSPGLMEVYARVNEALSVDVERRLLDQLEDDLNRRRRLARKWMNHVGATDSARDEMEREADQIGRLCAGGPLTEARARSRQFDATYCR